MRMAARDVHLGVDIGADAVDRVGGIVETVGGVQPDLEDLAARRGGKALPWWRSSNAGWPWAGRPCRRSAAWWRRRSRPRQRPFRRPTRISRSFSRRISRAFGFGRSGASVMALARFSLTGWSGCGASHLDHMVRKRVVARGIKTPVGGTDRENDDARTRREPADRSPRACGTA